MMMLSKVASANFMSVRLAPSTTTARGIPRPSLGLPALGSSLAAIGRSGAVRGRTERGRCRITPSMLCHSQAMPSKSSYSSSPACQMRSNTPCCSPSAESDHRPWCRRPVPEAAHSIGCRCAAHTEWPTPSADHLRQAVLLSHEGGAPESTGARAPIPHHSGPTVGFVSLVFSSIWGFLSFYHRFPNKLLGHPLAKAAVCLSGIPLFYLFLR